MSESCNTIYKLVDKDYERHLDQLFSGYVCEDARYIEIRIIGEDGKTKQIFYELNPVKPSKNIRLTQRSCENIYFGVLPRSDKKGAAGYVKVGKVLWADLDYKISYNNIEDVPIDDELKAEAIRTGRAYKQLNDHALIGVYRKGDKWIYIKRPPLTEVISKIKQTIGIEPTIVVDSGGGYHLYFKLIHEVDAKEIKKAEEKLVEILNADPQSKDIARVLRLPGSINPRLNRKVRIIYTTVHEYTLEEITKQLEKAWREKEIKKKIDHVFKHTRKEWRRLSEEEKNRVIDLLKEAWEKAEGKRFSFVGSLAGLFAKSGIAQEDCEDIVKRLYLLINREDMEHVRDIKYTYKDYMEGKPICAIECEGSEILGLRPLLESLLGEDKGQITLLELLRAISNKPRGGLAWLKATSNNGVTEWIGKGKSGIFIKRKTKDGIVYIRISRAVIKEVKRVKITGLEHRLKEVYKIELNNGQFFIGVAEDLAKDIKRYFGLKPGTEYALSILFDSLAEEHGEEELFYSPGPWVINNKIVIAEKPGYIASWKHNIKWKLISNGDIELGLTIIKRTVEAYKDPNTISTILSYGIIAWASHWFKTEFSIFPHMIISGDRGKGKTYILELLRLIYGAFWSEYPPTSDYQARRELSKSTIPYILTEANDFFRKLANDDKNAVSGLAILSKSATDIELRESGGYSYGGIFLGIRAFMGATNVDPENIHTFDADKFILVRLSKESGIDLSKVHGITPKAIKNDKHKLRAVASIFSEILPIFEKKIPEIRERLTGKAREELANEYISIGYDIWKEVFEKYSIEPFPEPAKISLENQVETIEDRYREAFISYLKRKKLEIRREIEQSIKFETADPIPEFESYDEITVLESLDYHFGAIYKRENKPPILILKPSFLSSFSTWAEKNLGLRRIGWRRLAEILGFKHTTLTIGEKRMTNILVKYIE